jgi:hypothetical protein
MSVVELLKTADGYLALGFALYVITLGKAQNEAIFREFKIMIETQLADQKELQKELMELLKTICGTK